MDFIVDFLIVAVFALCIFVGVKNGLIRSIIGLVVVAVAAALAVWLSEPVASGIYDLFIKKSLETAVAAQLPDMSSAQLTSQNVQEVISSLPAAIVKAAQSMDVDIAAISEKAGSVDLSASNIAAEICDSVAKPIAVAVLKVLSFAVIFFVCDFFLQIAAKAVCKLFELPVIRSVNRTLGGVFGALKGVFVAVFACLLLDAAASFAPGTQFASAVGASKLVSLIVSTDIFSRLITV